MPTVLTSGLLLLAINHRLDIEGSHGATAVAELIRTWISGEAARMEKWGDFKRKVGRISGLTRYLGD